MEMARESIAQGVYEPKALAALAAHTQLAPGWQYHSIGSKTIACGGMLAIQYN